LARVVRPPLRASVGGVVRTPRGSRAVVASFLGGPRVQAGGLGLSRDTFIAETLSELGVALCRGNTSLGRSGLYTLTRAFGRAPLRNLSCPSAEVVRGCPQLPFGRPWLTCVVGSKACLLWVCLMWLAFVCVWPRPLCLSVPMLLDVSLVPLCNDIFTERELGAIAHTRHKARPRNAKRSPTKHPKPTHQARDRPKQPQPRAGRDRTSVSGQRHASRRTRPNHTETRCLVGQVPEQRAYFIDLQRETEEKARLPETKLSTNTPHSKATRRRAKLNQKPQTHARGERQA
jgi:hypothetical protein